MTNQQILQKLSDVHVLLNNLQILGSSAEGLLLCKQNIEDIMKNISVKVQEDLNSEQIYK